MAQSSTKSPRKVPPKQQPVKLTIGKLLTECVMRGGGTEDKIEALGSHNLTPHQRVLLGLLLRQPGCKFTLAEASCFYFQTVVSLLNRGLLAFAMKGEKVAITPTSSGRIASHQSPPVEIVLSEL
jgi:hypothetical protein